MTKRIFCTALALFIMVMSFTQSVLAATENVVIKPEYTEDTAVSVSFKDGQSGGAQYVYTGDKVKPEVIVTKTDKTVAAPSEYKITYDDNCNELGVHFINVEYLKSGYTVMLDYYVVPGKTSISMSTKNGVVTLSWSSVKGAS